MVIIYGFGLHTERVLKRYCVPSSEVEAVIDSKRQFLGGGGYNYNMAGIFAE